MSSTTKIYEEKMTNCVNHLTRELATIRAGRANPAILDKVAVDYYGAPTPINQIAAVAVAEARILTITPWDGKMVKDISKAIQTSDIGINPMKKAGELTEDDQKNLEEEIQKMTDKFVKKIDETCAAKNQEIMEV